MTPKDLPTYPEQDHILLGEHYLRHVDAMTREGLHAKSAIAAQLAWRDAEIERLRGELGARSTAAQPLTLTDAEIDRVFDAHEEAPQLAYRYLVAHALLAAAKPVEPAGWKLTRSIIHECPALVVPQTWVQKLGMTAQLVVLKGADEALAQRILSALNAAANEKSPTAAAQPADAGPWFLTEAGSLQSADFTHDVRLGISGDFTNKDERLAYARGLCAKLNAAAAQPVEPTQFSDAKIRAIETKYGFNVAEALKAERAAPPAASGEPIISIKRSERESLSPEALALLTTIVRDVHLGGPDSVGAQAAAENRRKLWRREVDASRPAASGDSTPPSEPQAKCWTPDSCARFGCTCMPAKGDPSGALRPEPVCLRVPIEAISKLLDADMDRAVANGANSVSMPDELVEIAAWLAGIQGDPSGALRPEPEAVGQGRWWRKRPVVIEAFQWNGLESGCQAAKARFPDLETTSKSGHLRRPEVTSWHIRTLEGRMRVSPGDWIVRGVAGDFYPCEPDIFAATYEPAEPPQAASDERGD